MFLIHQYSAMPNLSALLYAELCCFPLSIPYTILSTWVCEAGQDQWGGSQSSIHPSMSSGRIPGEAKGLKKNSSSRKKCFLSCCEFRSNRIRSYHMHKTALYIHLCSIHEVQSGKKELLPLCFQFEPHLRKSGETLFQPFSIKESL